MDEHSDYSYIRSKEAMDAPYTTIPDMIRRHAEKDPESVAHVYINWQTFEVEHLTYIEIYKSAARFAKGLVRLGIAKTDIVALGMDNTPEWMTAFVGILMCGAIPLMFAFNLNDGSDIEETLIKAGHRCKAVIFSEGPENRNVSIADKIFKKETEKGKISHSSLPELMWSILMSVGIKSDHYNIEDICQMGNPEVELPSVDPEDVAAIFLTSGSTGSPKQIPHTHYFLMITGLYWSILHGRSCTTIFNDRPFGWLGGFPAWEIFSGRCRILIKHFSGISSVDNYYNILRKVLVDQKYESALIITGMLHRLLKDNNTEWRFQNVIVSGAPVPRMLTKTGSGSCQRFVVAYGTSEVSYVSYVVIDNAKEYLDYDAGDPLPGVEVKVVNSEGNIIKKGERGELYIRSASRFPGYMNEEEKTAKVLTSSGWYKSGDSAIIIDGHLIIEGRISDSVIKTEDGLGFISVAQMEERLTQHPDVEDALVAVVTDEDHFKRVCYAIVPKQGAQVTRDQLIQYFSDPINHTADLYSQIVLPKHFVFFDSFPRSFSGKVDRKKLANTCNKQLTAQ